MESNQCVRDTSLDGLPMEILIHICSFLEPSFILSVLSKVSHTFERIATDQAIWRVRIARRWPAKFPPVEPEEDFSWSDACAERESFFRQWRNVDTETECLTLKAHFSSVDAVLLLRDGDLLLSGSRDRSMALWQTQDMENGNPQKGLLCRDTTVHKGWVWNLNYNPETSQVISTGWDYKIHSWDLSDNSVLQHKSSINCRTALLCADLIGTNLVAVGTFDKKIKVYDLRIRSNNNGEGIEELRFHRLPVLSVVSNPNDENQLISASEDGTCALIDRRAKKILKRLHFSRGFPMCMKSFGSVVYVGDKVGNVHLLEVTPKNPLRKIRTVLSLHEGKVTGIDAVLGGVATCSTDSQVKLLHSDITGSLIRSIDNKDLGEVTAVSYLNGTLASGHSLESIKLWRPRKASAQEETCTG